ncbi:MAG: hypothetical protein RLZZ326_1838 [Planctomycetota bacterium]|jgi:hypothetical protein
MSESEAHADSRQRQSKARPKVRRRRTQGKLPQGCRFFRDPSLVASPTHPLATLSPKHRSAQRLKLIAGILARIALARGSSPPAGHVE